MFETSLASVIRSRPAMGTIFEVLLLGEDDEHLTAVAEATLDEIERVERLLSRFDPRSEISRINRLAPQQPVQVDCEVAGVLATCLDACRWTGGAFDITATSHNNGRRQPRDGAVLQPTAIPGIQFDRRDRLIRFELPDIHLDLGGFGKGYALDRAAEILAEYGVEQGLLHGGTSSVLARGLDESGRPWRIALRDAAGGEVVELTDAALSCSVVNEQADIVNPLSGLPLVENSSCAVVAESAAEAEILSTAAICLGEDEGTKLVASRQGCRVYWGERLISGGR